MSMKLLRSIIVNVLEKVECPLTNRDIMDIIIENNLFNFPEGGKSLPIKYVQFETRRLYKNGIISRSNNKDCQRQTCLYVAKNQGEGIDDYKLEYNQRKNKKENKKEVFMGIVVPSSAPVAVIVEDDTKEQVEMVLRCMVETVHENLDKTIGPEPDMFMDEIKELETRVIEESKNTGVYIEDNCWDNIKSFLVNKYLECDTYNCGNTIRYNHQELLSKKIGHDKIKCSKCVCSSIQNRGQLLTTDESYIPKELYYINNQFVSVYDITNFKIITSDIEYKLNTHFDYKTLTSVVPKRSYVWFIYNDNKKVLKVPKKTLLNWGFDTIYI